MRLTLFLFFKWNKLALTINTFPVRFQFDFGSILVRFRFDSGSILGWFWLNSGSLTVRLQFGFGLIPVHFWLFDSGSIPV